MRKMTLRKEDGIRSIVADEFDLMLFPEQKDGYLYGTYCDGEIFEFKVLPDLTQCSSTEMHQNNKVVLEKIEPLIDLLRKNEKKGESWSRVING